MFISFVNFIIEIFYLINYMSLISRFRKTNTKIINDFFDVFIFIKKSSIRRLLIINTFIFFVKIFLFN